MDFEELNPEDFNDPDIEEAWLQHMRDLAMAYLSAENVYYRQLDPKPAWHLAPVTTVWAVESTTEPGFVGWWAFVGDHPSDYISSAQAKSPREALQVLAQEWRELCRTLAAGKAHPTRSVGPPEQWPEIIAILEPRAERLLELTRDKALWKRA